MNYDAKPVRILYDDEKLKDRIFLVISGRDATLGITFVNLCYQLLQLAIQEHALEDPENTIYTNDEISPEDQVRVSRLLWELVWDRKIFLLFGRSSLLGMSNGEDRFVKY